MKKLLTILMLTLFCWSGASLHAEDTGKVINNKCRANLKTLNEGTAKFLKETDSGLPSWANFETIMSSLIDRKYFPEMPVPPTRDCKYNLVAVSSEDFQWYCDLHGVLDGEKSITFMYHEHRLMGKTSSRYSNIEKYREHIKDLLRWTEYTPTPTEKLKHQYNMNPLTTVILGVFTVLVVFLIYRNVT